MQSEAPFHIAIIGGGASGALMAAHLLRRRPKDLRVTIVEPRAELGRGLAFAPGSLDHLLNVRVANMSAFPDDPGHFTRWLTTWSSIAEQSYIKGTGFVSRALYGCYLENLVREHIGDREGENLQVKRGRANDIVVTSRGVEVGLASGSRIVTDVAVLACGHDVGESRLPLAVSPWVESATNVNRDAPVLILGTGLSMVDTALSLEGRGHRGRIVALSRRGLIPHAHDHVEPLRINAANAPFDRELSHILRWLRTLERGARAEGGWRAVVDGLRPHTQTLWRAMTPKRRARFLEHARPWWDIHRHRMAPPVAKRLNDMIASGRLEIIAGRVLAHQRDGDKLRVDVRRRGSTKSEMLEFARVISCTGVGGNPELSSNPLIRTLLDKGLARPDPLRIGVDVDRACAVLDKGGASSGRLFAVGPMSQAAFWEITAIPDIRVQTAELAADLLSRVELQVGGLRRLAAESALGAI